MKKKANFQAEKSTNTNRGSLKSPQNGKERKGRRGREFIIHPNTIPLGLGLQHMKFETASTQYLTDLMRETARGTALLFRKYSKK